MRTSEVDWTFPVLGLTAADVDVWGFNDLRSLTTCGPKTLKNDMQAGMTLIEAGGRQWVVRAVRPTGSARSLLGRLLALGSPLYRIEHELEAQPPATLPDTLERVCAATDNHPEYWCEDDERDTVLVARKAEVRAATSLRGHPRGARAG